MSLRRSAIVGALVLLCSGWQTTLAQTAETSGVDLADPRNAPLTLTSDIRTFAGSVEEIVGLAQGIQGTSGGLNANVQDLAKAMTTWVRRSGRPKSESSSRAMCSLTLTRLTLSRRQRKR